VTASTQGIGYAIAKRLAQEGAKVVVSSRKEKNVTEAVDKLKNEGLTVHGLVCHVMKAEDRKKLFEETKNVYGGLDILVSNAGTNPTFGAVLDTDENAWDKIFDINVKASYLLAKECLPYLRERGGGKIVFIASIVGFQPATLLGAYSVSKTALLGLTKAASQQLASENITVNCVAPGFIPTKFSSAITESEQAGGEILRSIGMERYGKPEEIAAAAAYLVSSDASYVTGETIIVSGGMPSRL